MRVGSCKHVVEGDQVVATVTIAVDPAAPPSVESRRANIELTLSVCVICTAAARMSLGALNTLSSEMESGKPS